MQLSAAFTAVQLRVFHRTAQLLPRKLPFTNRTFQYVFCLWCRLAYQRLFCCPGYRIPVPFPHFCRIRFPQRTVVHTVRTGVQDFMRHDFIRRLQPRVQYKSRKLDRVDIVFQNTSAIPFFCTRIQDNMRLNILRDRYPKYFRLPDNILQNSIKIHMLIPFPSKYTTVHRKTPVLRLTSQHISAIMKATLSERLIL